MKHSNSQVAALPMRGIITPDNDSDQMGKQLIDKQFSLSIEAQCATHDYCYAVVVGSRL